MQTLIQRPKKPRGTSCLNSQHQSHTPNSKQSNTHTTPFYTVPGAAVCPSPLLPLHIPHLPIHFHLHLAVLVEQNPTRRGGHNTDTRRRGCGPSAAGGFPWGADGRGGEGAAAHGAAGPRERDEGADKLASGEGDDGEEQRGGDAVGYDGEDREAGLGVGVVVVGGRGRGAVIVLAVSAAVTVARGARDGGWGLLVCLWGLRGGVFGGRGVGWSGFVDGGGCLVDDLEELVVGVGEGVVGDGFALPLRGRRRRPQLPLRRQGRRDRLRFRCG